MTDDSLGAPKAFQFNASLKSAWKLGGATLASKLIKDTVAVTASLAHKMDSEAVHKLDHMSTSNHEVDFKQPEPIAAPHVELEVAPMQTAAVHAVFSGKSASNMGKIAKSTDSSMSISACNGLGMACTQVFEPPRIIKGNSHKIKIEELPAEDIHIYDKEVIEEKHLSDKVLCTFEKVVDETFVRDHEIRELVQVVEDVVEVPKVVLQERIIEKEKICEKKVQKMVEIPQYETKVVQQPVVKVIEEVVEIPRVKLVEEVVHREIEGQHQETIFKTVEVPEIHERVVENPVEILVGRLVPKIVTRYVDKPIVVFNDIEKIVPRKRERIIEVPVYKYKEVVVEIPVVTEVVVNKYVDKVEYVEHVYEKTVPKYVTQTVEVPVTKTVTREIRREVPKIKTVIREVEVPVVQENFITREYDVVEEEIIEVPKRVEVVRNNIVETDKEEEVEVPVYVAKTKNIYHHNGVQMKLKQRTVKKHTKHVLDKTTRQKQVEIHKKVIHKPKFVDVERVEYVDVVQEVCVDKFTEEIIRVPSKQITYQEIIEPVEVIRKKYKTVEVTKVHKIPKYVNVASKSKGYKETVVHVPKIQYKDKIVNREVIRYIDVPHVVENIVEVPKITRKDRIIETYIDEWVDIKREVPVVQTIHRYVEKPVTKMIERIIEIPKVVHTKKVKEVEDVIIKEKFVEVVNIQEQVNYIDVEVEEIKEEIVQIPKITWVDRYEDIPRVRKVQKLVEVPEIAFVDRDIEIPKLVKVEKIVEIPREVHFEICENKEPLFVDMGTEHEEEVFHDSIEVRGDDLEPKVTQTEHEWDQSSIPPRYREIPLPDVSHRK
jgi:hypothetical protein